MPLRVKVGYLGTFIAGTVCVTGEYQNGSGNCFPNLLSLLFSNIETNCLTVSPSYAFSHYVNTSKSQIKLLRDITVLKVSYTYVGGISR